MQDITDIIMPIAIGIIMFGIGLELHFSNFKKVFTHPKAILTGLFCQMILLPLIAFSIVYFWPMDDIYKVGVMLVAACPGGTASNLLAKILNGKVALSVSLTSFNSFLILLTIPAIVGLSFTIFTGESQSVDLGFMKTMKQILLTVALPVLGGIVLNDSTSESFSEKLKKPLKFILPIILVGAFVVVIFFDNSGPEISYLENLHLLIPLVTFNLSTILAGYYISKKMKLSHKSSFTIAIEMGLQNSALALFIANQLLEDKDVTTMAVLYSSFSFLSTWGLAYLLKKKWWSGEGSGNDQSSEKRQLSPQS